MTTIISTHSFRGGTGKSNITANLAVLLAMQGHRVGVFDTDIQSPGIHVIFGLDDMPNTLNGFLWGDCTIEEAAQLVYNDALSGGEVHFVPSSIEPNDIARVLREKYDAGDMHRAFRELNQALDLDYLLIDTHPGLNEETLLSIAMSDKLLIVLRPDQQDFQGTSVTVDVARRLRVPDVGLVVNKVPDAYDWGNVKAQVEETYDCDVVSLVGLSTDITRNASRSVFCIANPNHPFSTSMEQIVAYLLAEERVTA